MEALRGFERGMLRAGVEVVSVTDVRFQKLFKSIHS